MEFHREIPARTRVKRRLRQVSVWRRTSQPAKEAALVVKSLNHTHLPRQEQDSTGMRDQAQTDNGADRRGRRKPCPLGCFLSGWKIMTSHQSQLAGGGVETRGGLGQRQVV